MHTAWNKEQANYCAASLWPEEGALPSNAKVVPLTP